METRLMMWLLLYQSVRILCILRLVMLYQASLSGQSEKSRNLDTVAQLSLEFLATRAVTISERYKKHLMHLTVFSQFQGKQQRRMSMEMNPKIIHICDFTWNWKGKGECRPVQNWLSDTILYLRYIFKSSVLFNCTCCFLAKKFKFILMKNVLRLFLVIFKYCDLGVCILGFCSTAEDVYAWVVFPMLMSTMFRYHRIWHFHFGCEMLPMFQRICHPLSHSTQLKSERKDKKSWIHPQIHSKYIIHSKN